MKAWIGRPATRVEAVLVPLGVGIVVWVVGWNANKSPLLVILVAASVALGVFILPHLRLRGLMKLGLLLVILPAIGVLLGASASVGAYPWHKTTFDPYVAPSARPEIHIKPCPLKEETLTRRPDGSYVCLIPIPSAPATGPYVAPKV